MAKFNFWESTSTSTEHLVDKTTEASNVSWTFDIESLLKKNDPNGEKQSIKAIKSILDSKTFREMSESQKKQFDTLIKQYRYLENDSSDGWFYMLLASLEKLEKKFINEQSVSTTSSEWRWKLQSSLPVKTENKTANAEQWKTWSNNLESSSQILTENKSIMKIWELKWQVTWSYNAAKITANAINTDTIQSKTVEWFKKVWQDNWWKDVEITWDDLSWLWEAAKWSKSAIQNLINEIYLNAVNPDGTLNLDSELKIDWQKVDIKASFATIEEKLVYINNLLQEVNKLSSLLKDNYNWVLKYIDSAAWVEETSRWMLKKWIDLAWAEDYSNDGVAILIEWLLWAFWLYLLSKLLPIKILKLIFWAILYFPNKRRIKNKIERRVQALRVKYSWISGIPESEINWDPDVKNTLEKLMQEKVKKVNIESAFMKKYKSLEFIEKQEINTLLRDTSKTKADVQLKINEILSRWKKT